jgi:hypothetical protein
MKTNPGITIDSSPPKVERQKNRWRAIGIVLFIAILVSFLTYRLEIVLGKTPSLDKTFTLVTQAAPQEVGSYDVLGYAINQQQATRLLDTEEGRKQLSPENGAFAVTNETLKLGRDAFYSETFGNEIFQTDVVGALNGPINIITVGQAIVKLGGKHTTNLQIPVNEDVTVGDRTFKAGTLLNTGLDVPANSFVPLGMRASFTKGKLRFGITCALCHATIDNKTGKILEGAPNNDVNTGLVLAFATNSAAMFRQTDINPTQIPAGKHTYINANGEKSRLPDAKALEDAVDAKLLT